MDKRVLAIGAIIIVLLAGVAIWLVSQPKPKEKLVIYTYDYFFGLTGEELETQEIYQLIFGRFEEKYGVDIEVKFFDGARNILLAAVTEKKAGARTADLLIGLDNIVIQEAKREGILEKINVSLLENFSKIRSDLVEAFDPEYYGIPYDFGPIAFVYDSKRISIENLTFEDFVEKDWDSLLVVESPVTSTTGISFLLWQITLSEKVLKKDWKTWWQTVKDDIIVTESWGDAYFAYFLDESKNRPIVVSYLTSPVYHWYYDNTSRYKAMLTYYNDTWYAWAQIQGIAIVKDSPMKDIAYKFIDWLLSDEVQSLVALNDIMLPANVHALNNLPEGVINAMGYNLDDIVLLNSFVTTNEIYNNIETWLDEWESIFT